MPKQITKWECNLCRTEYSSEKRAEVCEMLGEPSETKDIKVGDTISFTRDVAEPGTGEIKSYIKSDGTILAKELKFNSRTNKHHALFIVSTSDEQGAYEGLVAMLNIAGKDELFCAASPRYKPGFAATLTAPKTNGE